MQQLDDVAKRLEVLSDQLGQTTLDPTLGKLLTEMFAQKQLIGRARAEIADCLPMLGLAGQIVAGLDATRAVKPAPSEQAIVDVAAEIANGVRSTGASVRKPQG